MKKYVITLSEVFPVRHVRAGELTFFRDQFLNALKGYDGHIVERWYDEPLFINGRKIHTIRANYDLWEKRIGEVERGEACLSVRYWSRKPYRSKQIEIAQLTAHDGIGLQRIDITNDLSECIINGKRYNYVEVAKNDGLNAGDWINWFSTYELSKPLAVIHFTNFRY